MYVQADIHCYHCGDVPGIWEWPTGRPADWGRFRPTGGEAPAPGQLTDLRCARCRGPVFLDDIRPRPTQRPAFVYECGRRGRPRKSPARLAS